MLSEGYKLERLHTRRMNCAWVWSLFVVRIFTLVMGRNRWLLWRAKGRFGILTDAIAAILRIEG